MIGRPRPVPRSCLILKFEKALVKSITVVFEKQLDPFWH